MRSGPSVSVLKLYEWLPPQGEIRVVLRSADSDLLVDVYFENEDDSSESLKSIVFLGVCCSYFVSVPGIDLLAIEFDKASSLGDLVEYKDSEAAIAWSNHFRYRTIRHFELYFLAENRRLEVFAEAVNLKE